jgi:hypothetical protein
LHICARCGQERHSKAELGEGRLCQACYHKALAAKGRCPRCGELRRLLTYQGFQEAICAACAGVPARSVCVDCGAEDLLYAQARCAPCCLRLRLNAVLGPPDGPRLPALEPLRTALQNVAVPRTALDWLQRAGSARLLSAILNGELDLSHAALDALEPTGAVRFLDHLLVAAGVLDERDAALSRLDRWITNTLGGCAANTGDLRAVRTWLTWVILPRRRRGPPLTEGRVNRVKNQVRAVLALLRWLDDSGRRLAVLDQSGVEQWSVAAPAHYRLARPFLAWARRQRLSPALRLPPAGRTGVRPMEAADWTTAHRLLHDRMPTPGEGALGELRLRIAGLLVLLYAQPVTRISRLNINQVTPPDEASDAVALSLGNTAITCPPRLGELLTLYLGQRRYLSAVQPVHDEGWLFPGRTPGRPVSSTALARQLRLGGVHTATARRPALLHLAASMPPSVVADLLGISIRTTTELSDVNSFGWARCVGDRLTAT